MTKDEKESNFTHFTSANLELPSAYYLEMGRALYRWSQLESTAANLAASIMNLTWLEAVQRLRGGGGFKTKNIFEQLSAAAGRRSAGAAALEAIELARTLYEKRKVLFHSLWGHATGRGVTAVAIQEWSAADYANFRSIELQEIGEFATECRRASELLMQNLLPTFHDAEAVTIDDEDGLPRGVAKSNYRAR